MTLLGKIFRPWDLASDADVAFPKTESGVENASNSLQPLKSSPKSEESEFHPKSCESVSNSKRQSSVEVQCPDESGGDAGVGMAPEFSPFYMASSRSSPASSFITSSSIDELASLSRSELTAMGLLPPEAQGVVKVKRQRPKRFRCPHCQVAFSNNGQLRGHIRIHTGERPFACEHEGCGKSFTRNEELTRHRRIHTGLRPYPCSHCGKKFGRKDHLKKHTRTHQRPLYSSQSTGLIGLGSPFHPFPGSLMPTHAAIAEFGSPGSPYALPFMMAMAPPISHFPFS